MEKINLNNKTIYLIIGTLILIGMVLFFNRAFTEKVIQENMVKVKFETNRGDIVIQLYDEMPITSGNFKSLVEKETYDGVVFHRVIEEFMIQGGDPTGTGYGDSNIPNIKDEFTKTDLDKNNRGTISMANAGPNTGSSQFFINLVDNNFLDGKHPVFGKVIEGMDIVDDISKVETDANDKPLEKVVILKASLIN